MAEITLVKGHAFAVTLNHSEWERLQRQNPHRVKRDAQMLQEVITKGLQMLTHYQEGTE